MLYPPVTKEKKYGQRRYTKRKAKDFVDMDYLDKLEGTPAADFMDKFNKEFYQGDFRHEDPLHNTDKLRKDCYSKNNERLRDGWNKWNRTPQDLTDKIIRVNKQPDDTVSGNTKRKILYGKQDNDE